MDCKYWVFRDEGYVTICINEFGWNFTYLIVGDQYFMTELNDPRDTSKAISQANWTEYEEALVMQIIVKDRDNRFNTAIETGLRSA